MKISLSLFSAIRSASLMGLVCTSVSCVSDRQYEPQGNVYINERRPRYGWQGTESPTGGNEGNANNRPNKPPRNNRGEDPSKLHDGGNPPVADNPTQPEVKPEKPVTDPTPPVDEVKPKPNPTANLPFGTPVIGKKGFVYSPFAPDKGMVDVNDIPSGTKVECPYTKKIFRVP